MEVQFKDISVGTQFLDEYSGCYWTKINEDTAILEYPDSGYSKDFFYPDEPVIVED